MSQAVPNEGLFRLYAVMWLVGLSMAAVVVHELAGPPKSTVVAYLAIGAGLWVLDLVLVATRRRAASEARRDGYAVAHAVLTAALALAWPLVIAGILAFLAVGFLQGMREEAP